MIKICPKCGQQMKQSIKNPDLFYCPTNLRDPTHKSFWQPAKPDKHEEIMNALRKLWAKVDDLESQFKAFAKIFGKINNKKNI